MHVLVTITPKAMVIPTVTVNIVVAAIVVVVVMEGEVGEAVAVVVMARVVATEVVVTLMGCLIAETLVGSADVIVHVHVTLHVSLPRSGHSVVRIVCRVVCGGRYVVCSSASCCVCSVATDSAEGVPGIVSGHGGIR